MKTILGENHYDRKELAELLGVSLPTISSKMKKGEIPFIVLSGKYYTSETALKRFLNGETTAPTAKENK